MAFIYRIASAEKDVPCLIGGSDSGFCHLLTVSIPVALLCQFKRLVGSMRNILVGMANLISPRQESHVGVVATASMESLFLSLDEGDLRSLHWHVFFVLIKARLVFFMTHSFNDKHHRLCGTSVLAMFYARFFYFLRHDDEIISLSSGIYTDMRLNVRLISSFESLSSQICSTHVVTPFTRTYGKRQRRRRTQRHLGLCMHYASLLLFAHPLSPLVSIGG